MIKKDNQKHEIISEQVMLARLAQSEQMREFNIEMWKQNPILAEQGGERVRQLLAPLDNSPATMSTFQLIKQRGISLIELIIFIVIISVALTGILLVMNQVTRHSADPLIHKQAIAVAESLLEEIELQDFVSASGATVTVTQANRASDYHIVRDYNTFGSTTGIFPVSGVAPIAGLENYDFSVAVTDVALTSPIATVAAGSAVRITVTVTDPQGSAIAIDGYRTAY
jgi:MSHA pilin protein MshD